MGRRKERMRSPMRRGMGSFLILTLTFLASIMFRKSPAKKKKTQSLPYPPKTFE